MIDKIKEEDWLAYAQSAYYAYGAFTGMKAWNGTPMPEWDNLPDAIKQAWVAATKQVAYQITHEADI